MWLRAGSWNRSSNKGVLEKFEEVLNRYFTSDKPNKIGLPSVAYCADELHLSANYFGDLIKKETGKSAQEHIQLKLMDVAKERIFDTEKSIREIAFDLGFNYRIRKEAEELPNQKTTTTAITNTWWRAPASNRPA